MQYLVAIVFFALLLGCEQPPQTGDDGRVDTRRFGDPYQILMNESTALPDELPALMSDTLIMLVSYSGGCEDHDLDLKSEVEQDTAKLWLKHDANGDSCEAIISDRFEVRVPDEVLEAPTIVLLNPNEDVPFILRWRPDRP